MKSTLSLSVAWCGIHFLDPRHQHPPSDNNPWLCDQMIMITRCSEKDNTPQPLDQWTNSPFMGQQIGNCDEFHIDTKLGRSICHALWAKSKSIMRPILYPTHISFIPSQSTFPLIKYGYWNLTLKIQVQGHWWGQSLKVAPVKSAQGLSAHASMLTSHWSPGKSIDKKWMTINYI